MLPSKAGGGQAYIDLQDAHYLALKLFNVASSQISQQLLRDDNFTFRFFSVSRSPKRLQEGAAMLGTPAFVLQGSGEKHRWYTENAVSSSLYKFSFIILTYIHSS